MTCLNISNVFLIFHAKNIQDQGLYHFSEVNNRLQNSLKQSTLKSTCIILHSQHKTVFVNTLVIKKML